MFLLFCFERYPNSLFHVLTIDSRPKYYIPGMKKISRYIKTVFLVSIVVVISGCISVSKESFYANQYGEAIKNEPAIDLVKENLSAEWVEKQFSGVMNQFKAEDVEERAKRIFAPNLYFNDTWHTHTNSKDLGSYLKRTGERVHFIEVLVDDVAISQSSAYVRWNMSFIINEGDEPIKSVGMTHLRFNEDKQIVTYQDYWDGVEGFYRTLPVIGGVLAAIRKRMG